MRATIGVFAACVLNVFSCLNAEGFDLEGDQQIALCISSNEFSNSIVNYRFNDYKYPIRIIHNPQEENLWGGDLSDPISLSLIMTSNLPFDLAFHLENLVLELGDNFEYTYIDLKGSCDLSVEEWGLIHPVYIAERIDDPICDAGVKNAFTSATFFNEVFYYYLEGKYYRVRILHNPEGRAFSATKKYSLFPGASLKNYSISWDHKYGIIVDKTVSQELIDHLSGLVNCSWWDWYFNFRIENGGCVEHETSQYGYDSVTTTTYSLDSWFYYTESLR